MIDIDLDSEEEQDQQLSVLFEEANIDLPSTAFSQRVMFDLRKQNRRDTFIWMSRYVVALALMWVFAPYIQRASQVIASLPGDGMALLTESLQLLSPFPLTYILAVPFLAYAFLSR